MTFILQDNRHLHRHPANVLSLHSEEHAKVQKQKKPIDQQQNLV